MTNYNEYENIDKKFPLPKETAKRVSLLGVKGENIRVFETELQLIISENGEGISLSGLRRDIEDAVLILNEMVRLLGVNQSVKFSEESVKKAIDSQKHSRGNLFQELGSGRIYKNEFTGQPFYAKSPKQVTYLNQIYSSNITISFGAAGSAKTFLSVIAALNLLKKGDVEKIVITRPVAIAEKAGIGFMPGSLYDKMSVYLTQILSDIERLTSKTYLQELLDTGTLEILNIGLARGRSFDNTALIIDEAENMNYKEFELMLTRIGTHSKIIITGDPVQSDIGSQTALDRVANMIKDVDGVGFTRFGQEDIVRSVMASKMVEVFSNNRKETKK